MKAIFSLFIFVSSFGWSAEYIVRPIGTEKFDNISWEIKNINDKGQVLCQCNFSGNQNDFASTKDSNFSSSEVSNKAAIINPNGNVDFIEYSQSLYPKKINNKGTIVGSGYQLGEYEWDSFIWDKNSGFKAIKTFFKTSKVKIPKTQVIDFNNDNKMIIYYSEPKGIYSTLHYFLIDNGSVVEFDKDSKCVQLLENLGYYVMSVRPAAINDNGAIVGTFTYGKYHPYKHKYVDAGSLTFFWDNDNVFVSDMCLGDLKINNNGKVLSGQYLWDPHGDLIQFPKEFCGISLNDKDVVLGEMYFPDRSYVCYAIYQNGNITLLEDKLGKPLDAISDPYSYDMCVESISQVYQINNKGQILVKGRIWGEDHPCIIEPKK